MEVFDHSGNVVWSLDAVPKVTDSPTVSVAYVGPELLSGRTYQFRATSWRDFVGMEEPLSRTEDLRGVFVVE